MGVEHVVARLEPVEVELENPPLCLTLHDRVHSFQSRRERGAVIEVVEEVGVEVEGVGEVELDEVAQVDPDRAGAVDRIRNELEEIGIEFVASRPPVASTWRGLAH